MRAAAASLTALVLLVGCDTGDDGAQQARALVEAAFAEKVAPGLVGVEAVGKGVWYRAEALNGACLHGKEWAFSDTAGSPRLSPTYAQQSVVQSATEAGFCIGLGEGLNMTTDKVNKLDDAWVVDTVFTMERPAPWWECVDEGQKRFPVRVLAGSDGALSIEHEPGLWGGACPDPMPTPANLQRSGSRVPAKQPPHPATRAEVIEAVQRLDDALWAHNLRAVLDATACYNLYEDKPFGACSGAEVVNVGPMPRDGGPRRSDGPPWTNNALQSLDDIGIPFPDPNDRTMFYAQVKAATGKRPRRTIAVQWERKAWRVVGAVQRQAQGLTSVEYLLDLDRPEKRGIFDRRVGGEDIDVHGHPPEPPPQ